MDHQHELNEDRDMKVIQLIKIELNEKLGLIQTQST